MDEQTSFQITPTENPGTETAPPTETLLDSAAAVMDSLLEKERAQLRAFADLALTSLMAARPNFRRSSVSG